MDFSYNFGASLPLFFTWWNKNLVLYVIEIVLKIYLLFQKYNQLNSLSYPPPPCSVPIENKGGVNSLTSNSIDVNIFHFPNPKQWPLLSKNHESRRESHSRRVEGSHQWNPIYIIIPPGRPWYVTDPGRSRYPDFGTYVFCSILFPAECSKICFKEETTHPPLRLCFNSFWLMTYSTQNRSSQGLHSLRHRPPFSNSR